MRMAAGSSAWPSSRSLVPHPLGNDLPALLAAGGMTTPAIRLLLLILVGESIFKGAAMQVKGHDVSRSESVLRQLRQEEFIGDAFTFHSNPTLGCRSRMRGDHDPAELTFRANRQIRTVVESAAGPAFRMGEVLVWGQVQTGLDRHPLLPLCRA